MFERAYQGAPSFDILNPQLCKVVGSVQRVFDKALRGHVYQLVNNGSQTMLTMPKEDKIKQGLGLVQPCLVLQVFLPQGRDKSFSLEVGVTDSSRSRRRLLFSTSSQEAPTAVMQASGVQVRLPLVGVRRGTWLNLCLDMDSLVRGAFGQVMKSLDSISVHAECRLRRIFTLRSLPQQSEIVGCMSDGSCELEYEQPTMPVAPPAGTRLEPIPRSYEFPVGIDQHTQLVSGDQAALSIANDGALYSVASPDASHPMQCELIHDISRSPDDEFEEFVGVAAGGLPSSRRLSRTPTDMSKDHSTVGSSIRASTGERLVGTLAPLSGSPNDSADPVGYEEMIRRASLSHAKEERDAPILKRAVTIGAAPAAGSSMPDRHHAERGLFGSEMTSERPEGCALPEAGRARRTVSNSDKVGKSGPPPRSAGRDAPAKGATACPSLQAACLGATVPRRKSQRRPGELSMPQVRNSSDPGSRRCPASTKAMDRSPSNHKPRQPRPLPLEIGGLRSARDDGGGSAPCSGSGAPPSSARRGHRLAGGRLPAAQRSSGGRSPIEEETISPSQSAATRRRRELAKQTLHKTAEIYGVHKHPSLAKGADRGADERLESRTPVLGTRGEEARDFEDDVGEPPPALHDNASLEVLPECGCSSPLGSPTSDVSRVLQAAIALGPREQTPLGSALPSFSQDQRRRPQVIEAEPYLRADFTEYGPHTPASSASMVSPARVLGERAEVADDMVFDEACGSARASADVAGESLAPLDSAREADLPANAWSAFVSTVRHHGHHSCWPPMGSALPEGAGAYPSALTGYAPHEAHLVSERSLGHEHPDVGIGVAPYDPPERCPFDECMMDSGSLFGAGSYFNEGDAGEHYGDDFGYASSYEDSRRIKSMSPPRRIISRQRPHPISGLDGFPDHLGPADPSAPSSAPSEFEHHGTRWQPAPFSYQNDPTAPLHGGFRYDSVGNIRPGVLSEENDNSRSASVEELFPQRPFTPPVVPVGKLLRSVFESTRTAAPENDPSGRRPSRESYQWQDAVWLPQVDSAAPPGSSEEPPGMPDNHRLRSQEEPSVLPHTDTERSEEDTPTDFGIQDYPFDGCEAMRCSNENGGASHEQMLEAIYDPVLDVYYDPRSNKYYERRRGTNDLHDVEKNLRV